jgi:hypothetical protein
MEPVVVQCSSACTVTLQLEQVGPFSFSAADGAILSGLVVGLWLTGFGIRALIRVLSGNQAV